MKNAVSWLCFAIKLLLWLVALPFVLAWLAARYLIFRSALTRSLTSGGLTRRECKALARELAPLRLLAEARGK